MGEQGGLRTGWLAAFGTEGYDGEPPLLEELGVNFEHIRTKVGISSSYPLFLYFLLTYIPDLDSAQPTHHPLSPHHG